MPTFAESEFADSAVGELRELPRTGSALENPYVYDASARELKAMAEHGLLEVAAEEMASIGPEQLIASIRFRRLK